MSLRSLTFSFGCREGTLKDATRRKGEDLFVGRGTVLPLFSDTREREGDELFYERLNDRIVDPATSQYFFLAVQILVREKRRERKGEREREREKENEMD